MTKRTTTPSSHHPVGETPPPLLRQEGSPAATPSKQGGELFCSSPGETFALGEKIGSSLVGGDLVLMYGGLGAGKTLMTKGILHALGYDIDEVTSPSFTLVNLYKTQELDIYHIDLWRLDVSQDIAAAVGLDEIFEDPRAVTVIEWADRLGDLRILNNAIRVYIDGDGDEMRTVRVEDAN
jgi:tRNA threonylcarbamoyladenosine biosynthesis protein TsaE